MLADLYFAVGMCNIKMCTILHGQRKSLELCGLSNIWKNCLHRGIIAISIVAFSFVSVER